jgi:hypothetical protein
MAKSPQVIRIKSKEQFDWLIDHLVTETHRAWDHWDLWGGLDKALAEYGIEINQTSQFWRLTIRAHQDSVILRLGRLFDPHPIALSLGNMLQTIHNGVTNSTFSDLGIEVKKIDLKLLQTDLEMVSEGDPLVSQLIDIRNDYLAHRASRLVSSKSIPTLQQTDIATLLTRASSMLEKYGPLCGRPIVSRHYVGEDDYKYLLDLLRLGLAARRTEGNFTITPSKI